MWLIIFSLVALIFSLFSLGLSIYVWRVNRDNLKRIIEKEINDKFHTPS
jgi:hypothetical protein